MDKTNVLRQKPNFFVLLFMVSIGLVGFAVNAADSMSNKYFPSNSPILANYYPNDFLPWGVLLFLGLGWLTVNFLCKYFDGDWRQLAVVLVVLTTIFAIMAYMGIQLRQIWWQDIEHSVWASYLSELIGVWANAWTLGGIWAFYNYRLAAYFEKVYVIHD